MYGLKQAPRAWYERLHNYLTQIDFKRANDNSNLSIKEGSDNKIVLAEIFVDDTMFTGNDDQCKEFLELMNKEFEMSMFGQIKFFVGLQIQQNKNGIYITQSKYIREILKKFGMQDSKLVGTPMCTRLKLTKDDDSKEVDQTLYKSMIGKLQYVVHTRPDIALAVGIVARFSAKPRENHMMASKRILRYLRGTEDYGLWYKFGGNLDLKVFTNADWARNIDDRKSTSGGAFFLGKRLVSWTSKKQNYTSQSTTEVEYVAAVVNCYNIIWFKQLLEGMKVEIKEPVVMFCDNTSAINISKNLVMHSKTKHIAIKYHFVRELVQDKEIRLEYIHTKEQIVDIFTKPLPKDAFLYLRGKLGVTPLSEVH